MPRTVRVVFLGALLVAPSFVDAQEVTQDQVPRLPAIDAGALAQKFDKNWLVSRLQGRFAHIKSYMYAYHQDSPQHPGYFRLCWKEKDDAHYLEFEEPSQKIHDIFVYDGARTSLSNGSGNVYVRKGENVYGKPQTSWQSPLDVYAFLSTGHQFLSVKQLGQEATIWKEIAGRMDYAGTGTFLGCDCIIMKVRGAFDQMKEEKATYEVYFDAATLTPLRWQSYDDQGYMIGELALADLKVFAGQQNQDETPFAYVPNYTITQYQWLGITHQRPDGGIAPYFKAQRDEAFDDVRVNSLVTRRLYSIVEHHK